IFSTLFMKKRLLFFFLFCASLAQAAPPTLPSINVTNIFNVTNYGASTASADNKTAIQNAINAAAAATAGVGGGTVAIPGPGPYMGGALTLKKKVNLQVDASAVLKMLPMTNWSGTTTFIYGSSLNDVEISGTGTIDGNGKDWWDAYNATSVSRPNFIEFSKT